MSFAELAARPWQAELVVFSGCSTSVAGLVHGHELAGVSLAAAEAGASAVIGSLWPVDDRAAERFMTAFYAALTNPAQRRDDGLVDLRAALRAGQTAVRQAAGGLAAHPARGRDGRRVSPVNGRSDLPDPAVAERVLWGAFVLLGDPLMPAPTTAPQDGTPQ